MHTPPNVRFIQIGTGDSQNSIALGNDGNVYTWGYSKEGQSGLGSKGGRSVPARVPLPWGVGRFIQIQAGNDFNIALADNGRVYSWGCNSRLIYDPGQKTPYGNLGVGDNKHRYVPTPVVGIPNHVRITSISAGSYSAYALGNDGNIYAWGFNDYGQLGIGNSTVSLTAAPVRPPAGLRWTSLTTGGNNTFATTNNGVRYAWGANGGLWGNGSKNGSSRPVVHNILMPPGVGITQMNSKGAHTLAIGSNQKTYAWGSNLVGGLGTGNTVESTVPVEVRVPNGVAFISVATSTLSSFAIGNDGGAYAWGRGRNGQIGDGHMQDRLTPVRVGGRLHIERVIIDGQLTPGTSEIVSGIWRGSTQRHQPGDVIVSVEWTLDDILYPAEPLRYTFLAIYTVAFNLSGAPGNPPGNQYIVVGSKASPPGAPTWYDHHFTGWYLDGHPYNFNEPVNRHMTLTAGWEYYNFALTPNTGPVEGGTLVTITANTIHTFSQFNRKLEPQPEAEHNDAEAEHDDAEAEHNDADSQPDQTVEAASVEEGESKTENETENETEKQADDKQDNDSKRESDTTAKRQTPKFEPRTPANVVITGVTIDGQAPQTGPTYNPLHDGWDITTPPHMAGPVTVTISWTLSGVPQNNRELTYTYTSLILPEAGSTPIERLGGTSLLALGLAATTFYAALHQRKRRQHKTAQHRQLLQ
ncbi:hypothetical protein KIMH_00450 [Bombiscardovia apis]|uniref:RCC1-like domain-containing protein n=1 Tax=Bombiscardovia apis TaxID=2932182 RepID=A0ABN6SE49_9BIFI|nr:hypothetical protein KIMH_00450 [Bombiscardovia apis]